MPEVLQRQDELFEEAMNACGGALEHLARAYEAVSDAVRDLLWMAV